jgi:hypothetical protein
MMHVHASVKVDVRQLAIAAAVAVADAPFAELEHQSRELAAMAACGFLTKQDAVDVAHTAALAGFGPGMFYGYVNADAIQEIIAAGFKLEDPQAPPAEPPSYRTPQSTVDAFWYVVRLNDQAYLLQWLSEHPKDAAHLEKLLEEKCRTKSR